MRCGQKGDFCGGLHVRTRTLSSKWREGGKFRGWEPCN